MAGGLCFRHARSLQIRTAQKALGGARPAARRRDRGRTAPRTATTTRVTKPRSQNPRVARFTAKIVHVPIDRPAELGMVPPAPVVARWPHTYARAPHPTPLPPRAGPDKSDASRSLHRARTHQGARLRHVRRPRG